MIAQKTLRFVAVYSLPRLLASNTSSYNRRHCPLKRLKWSTASASISTFKIRGVVAVAFFLHPRFAAALALLDPRRRPPRQRCLCRSRPKDDGDRDVNRPRWISRAGGAAKTRATARTTTGGESLGEPLEAPPTSPLSPSPTSLPSPFPHRGRAGDQVN